MLFEGPWRIAAKRVSRVRRWQAERQGRGTLTPEMALSQGRHEDPTRPEARRLPDARARLLETASIARHPGRRRSTTRDSPARAGADPRDALRRRRPCSRKSRDEERHRGAEDASTNRASTAPGRATTLRLIDKYPARRAPDLAASQRRDPLAFKRDVLQLKQLGLTESLEIGYRLSPRGRAILAALISA